MQTVVGVFRSEGQADKAIDELRDAGFKDNDVSVVRRDNGGHGGDGGGHGGDGGGHGGDRGSHGGDGRDDNGSVTANVGIDGNFTNQNLSDGTATGGTLGGLAGLLAGAGALAIPGIGPIVAAGPIAGALSGAVSGGVAGGLVDFGVPEERGRHFEQEVRSGNILALVETDDKKVSEASMIFRRNGATDVETHEGKDRRRR